MNRTPHRGSLLLATFFVLTAIAMPVAGQLPLNMAIAAAVILLIYAAGLFALAFAPQEQAVRGQAAAPVRRRPTSSQARPALGH